MSEELKKEAFSEEELKEIRRRRRVLKKRRMEKKKARQRMRMQALLEDEEAVAAVEAPEVRRERLYAKAQKKMRFAPHMYRREDQADMYRQAAELFGEVAGYEEADVLRAECLREAEANRKLYVEETYNLTKELLAGAKTFVDCRKIRENLHAIEDFKDVQEMQEECRHIEQRLEKRQRNKKILKYFLIGVVILAVFIVILYIQGVWRI